MNVLKELRMKKGLSQAQASKLCGISQPHYGNIESGKILSSKKKILEYISKIEEAALGGRACKFSEFIHQKTTACNYDYGMGMTFACDMKGKEQECEYYKPKEGEDEK